MSVRGITFEKQSTFSKDFAHYQYTFLNHANGITKGCEITHDNDNIYITDGYFIVFGRFVKIDGTETIVTDEVLSGTKYCRLVFEIDLTKTNTVDTFLQGAFKVLSDISTYPTLTQEDLDAGGNIYQLSFCKFTKTSVGIANFVKEVSALEFSVVFTNTEKEKLAGIAEGAQVNTVTSVAGKTGAVTLTKSDVGLSNVDNTSDQFKPVSIQTQNALNLKLDADEIEEGNWTPTLRAGGSADPTTYAPRWGRYLKIGNKCRVWGHIGLATRGTSYSSATYALIMALPFTPANTNAVATVNMFSGISSITGLIGLVGKMETISSFYGVRIYYQSNTAATTLSCSQMTDGFAFDFDFEYDI